MTQAPAAIFKIPTKSPQLARGKAARRWRAVWHEDGKRQQCAASSEEKLAVRLEKVTERLAADAPNMRRPGADLIAWYLNSDRLPVDERWSRKHAHTQRRLCERFAGPVIDAGICQDIKTSHMQQIVNAAHGGEMMDPANACTVPCAASCSRAGCATGAGDVAVQLGRLFGTAGQELALGHRVVGRAVGLPWRDAAARSG